MVNVLFIAALLIASMCCLCYVRPRIMHGVVRLIKREKCPLTKLTVDPEMPLSIGFGRCVFSTSQTDRSEIYAMCVRSSPNTIVFTVENIQPCTALLTSCLKEDSRLLRLLGYTVDHIRIDNTYYRVLSTMTDESNTPPKYIRFLLEKN